MAKTIAVTDNTSTGIEQLKSQPARLSAFLKEVRSEMRKVWWPSLPEVQSTTIVVLITVFLFAAFFWLVDTVLGQVIERMLHTLSGH
jgi:preprotein translocase subunit SecE